MHEQCPNPIVTPSISCCHAMATNTSLAGCGSALSLTSSANTREAANKKRTKHGFYMATIKKTRKTMGGSQGVKFTCSQANPASQPASPAMQHWSSFMIRDRSFRPVAQPFSVGQRGWVRSRACGCVHESNTITVGLVRAQHCIIPWAVHQLGLTIRRCICFAIVRWRQPLACSPPSLPPPSCSAGAGQWIRSDMQGRLLQCLEPCLCLVTHCWPGCVVHSVWWPTSSDGEPLVAVGHAPPSIAH